MIKAQDINDLFTEDIAEAGSIFEKLGPVNSTHSATLSFIDDSKYLDQLNANHNITGVFAEKALASRIIGKSLLLVSDPRYYFFTLFNDLAVRNAVKFESRISGKALIHPKASVSDHNVIIGDNTVIGPNVSILPDVEIGRDCVIQAGAVIGSVGFEYKRTSRGIVPVVHDGKVIIGDKVEVGANTTIDKGFSFRNTIIGDETKLDNLVYVAHAVHIGRGCFVVASAALMGSVTVGEKVWIGPHVTVVPGLTVNDRAFVSVGSVVTKNVEAGLHVTGNFAIPHKVFLDNLKKSLS
jgi:UDP-3-O-[3-hydroxymyristoyl] glucosamine N-acyltransferase